MATTKQQRHLTKFGWAVTIAGCAMWTYGYFTSGSFSLIDWSAFSPHWISAYLPNWQAESGLLLTILGSIPLYLVQIQHYQQGP